MERKIVLKETPTNVISIGDVVSFILDSGIILVYNERNIIIGSVIYYLGNDSNSWVIDTVNDYAEYPTLFEILKDYPNLTFKFID